MTEQAARNKHCPLGMPYNMHTCKTTDCMAWVVTTHLNNEQDPVGEVGYCKLIGETT